MSQLSLQDLLGQIKSNHSTVYNDAAQGKSPSSAWDEASNLPIDREYRLRVDSAEFKASASSGREQFVITYVVVEPVEFAGAKFQDYQSPQPTSSMATEMLAKFFGALQLSLDNSFGNDPSAFIKQAEDRTVVAALRKWGENDDRTGIRWVNLDRGQNLSTSVKPPKPRGNSNGPTRPDINIPKGPEGPAPQTSVTPPQTPPPGGINLPPGLRS